MPRYYNHKQEPIDYCNECWEDYHDDILIDAPNEGDIGTDHPPYEETEYTCDSCFAKLTVHDN